MYIQRFCIVIEIKFYSSILGMISQLDDSISQLRPRETLAHLLCAL